MSRRALFAASLLIALQAVLAVSSMVHKSLTLDESGNYEFGRDLLLGEQLGFSMQRMPIAMLNALPVLVLERIHGAQPLETVVFVSRLATVFVSLLLSAFVFRWATDLYGPRAGLFALGVHILNPNLLAHSRWVTSDTFGMTFIFIAVYLFVRYLRAPSWRGLLVSALATGVAQIAKQTALLLFPLFGLIWFVSCGWPLLVGAERRGLGRRVSGVVAGVTGYLAIVVLIINAGYLFRTTGAELEQYQLTKPALVALTEWCPTCPVPLPQMYLEAIRFGKIVNATGAGHGLLYLLGDIGLDGWWYYYPVALLLKTPIGLLILLALSIWRIAVRRRPEEMVSVLFAGFIFILFTATVTAQIGIRYLLPIMPFLHLLTGRLFSDLEVESRRWMKAVALVSSIWYLGSVLSFHPHYLSYMNELIGERKNMYLYLADSNVDWGQNDWYLARYLEAHAGETITVSPDHPTTGTIIVSVNELTGVLRGPVRLRWLREHYRPVGHIAYSWLLFEVPANGS